MESFPRDAPDLHCDFVFWMNHRYVARKLQNIYRGRAVRRAIREVVDRNRLRCDIVIVDGKRFLVAKDPPRHRGKVYTYNSPSVGGPPPAYVGLLEEINGIQRVNSDIAEEELDLRYLHAQAKDVSVCVCRPRISGTDAIFQYHIVLDRLVAHRVMPRAGGCPTTNT